MRVRRLRGHDVDHLVEGIAATIAGAAAKHRDLDPHLDHATLRRALLAQRRATWVAVEDATLVGHLYGAVLDQPGRGREVFSGLDGVSGPEIARDALLAVARRAWRRRGASRHHVWVPHDEEHLEPWRRRGYRLEVLRGLRRLDNVAPVLTAVAVRAHGRVDDALAFEDLIDVAQGDAPTSGRARRARRSELASLLGETSTRHYLIEGDSGPIGQCVVFPAAPTRGTPGPAVHLSAVAVVAHERGRGWGRSLVDQVLADAAARTVPWAEVVWRAENDAAARFWRARGFNASLARLVAET